MRKILAILLALVLIVSVISCNKKEISMKTDTTSYDTDTDSDDSIYNNTDENADSGESNSSESVDHKSPVFNYERQTKDSDEYCRVINCKRNSYFAHYDEIAYLGSFISFSYKVGCLECECPDFDNYEYSYVLGNGKYSNKSDYDLLFTVIPTELVEYSLSSDFSDPYSCGSSRRIKRDSTLFEERHDLRNMKEWGVKGTTSETMFLTLFCFDYPVIEAFAEYDNETGNLLRIYMYCPFAPIQKGDYITERYEDKGEDEDFEVLEYCMIIDFSYMKDKGINGYGMTNEELNKFLYSDTVGSAIVNLYNKITNSEWPC